MIQPFRVCHSQAEHWGAAVKACVDGVGGISVPDDNLGFVYVDRQFGGDLSSLVTFLRETTGLRNWIGAAGFGAFASGQQIETETAAGGSVALMVGGVPPDALRLFDYEGRDRFTAEHGEWVERHPHGVALVHADPSVAPALLAELCDATGLFAVGGLTVGAEAHERVAGRLSPATVSGVMLAPPVSVVVGLTQGCVPIGGARTVTEAMGHVIMEIDDRPALDVLRDEAGELIARDLHRAAGYIHVGLPVLGSDTGDYVVRSLTGIDPHRGWIAVDAEIAPGDPVMFVRRDANAAQRDMRRMLASLHGRVGGGRVLAGLYVSCVARGANMFGAEGRELALIEDAFPDVPLIGFAANGEICGGRLYAYTGVLALIIGGAE